MVFHRTLSARSCGCGLVGKLLLPPRFLFPEQCAARTFFTSRVSFLFALPSVVLFLDSHHRRRPRCCGLSRLPFVSVCHRAPSCVPFQRLSRCLGCCVWLMEGSCSYHPFLSGVIQYYQVIPYSLSATRFPVGLPSGAPQEIRVVCAREPLSVVYAIVYHMR